MKTDETQADVRGGSPSAPTRKKELSARKMGLILFAGLLVLYLLNGDFLYGNDAKPNVYLPAMLLSKGKLSFEPKDVPFMFVWKIKTPKGILEAKFNTWDDTSISTGYGRLALPGTVRSLESEGVLEVGQNGYYIVPTVHPGRYVGTFMPGAGLTALPVFAVLDAMTENFADNAKVLWYGAKFVASALVAGSAVFIFFAATAYLSKRRALILALAYALGTCVWSLSSQTLWQHGPAEFYLAMGAFFLTRIGRMERAALWSGLGFAAAAACRPPDGLVLFFVGSALLLRMGAAIRRGEWRLERKQLMQYVLGAMPILILLAVYNTYYMGAPWHFAQTQFDPNIVKFKTGSDSTFLWQTPIPVGAAGLLLSPSRGLLSHSPFLIFAFWGAYRVWRSREYAALRPLTVAILAMWLIAFAWYDWWGGWCFGYRPIVDTMPLMAMLLIPVFNSIADMKILKFLAGPDDASGEGLLNSVANLKVLKWAFVVLLAWSVAVQCLGAYAYDLTGWNNQVVGYQVMVEGNSQPITVNSREELKRFTGRKAQVVGVKDLDIDRPANRWRLWSVSDSSLVYYVTHYGEARASKQAQIKNWLENPDD